MVAGPAVSKINIRPMMVRKGLGLYGRMSKRPSIVLCPSLGQYIRQIVDLSTLALTVLYRNWRWLHAEIQGTICSFMLDPKKDYLKLHPTFCMSIYDHRKSMLRHLFSEGV